MPTEDDLIEMYRLGCIESIEALIASLDDAAQTLRRGDDETLTIREIRDVLRDALHTVKEGTVD